MNIATYSRISTDEERQPFSLDAQAERMEAYIASQPGWKPVRRYSDQVSGKTLDRPGLAQALAEARLGIYQTLVVFKVDRLARSTGGLARVLEELERAGVAFRSVSEPFDTATAAGRMMVQMLGVFAEFEREMIVERTKMGLAKKASKGEWTGGTPPYGYRYDIDARVLVPVPEEARLVRRIFELYAERGMGSTQISNWLHDSARTTKRASRWAPTRVLEILRNPTYVGSLPFRGQVYEAAHEPIVERELYEKAQAVLAERGESTWERLTTPSDYILSGLVFCSRCGERFLGTAAHGHGGDYRYYTCGTRQRKGTARCDQQRIPADKLEEGIVQLTIDELLSGEPFRRAAEAQRAEWESGHPSLNDDILTAKEAIAERHRTMRQYMAAFEKGEMPPALCGERLRELETEIAVLEEERSVLESRLTLLPEAPSDDYLADIAHQLQAASNDADHPQLKKILKIAVRRIEVQCRAHIQPFFKVPEVRMTNGSPPLTCDDGLDGPDETTLPPVDGAKMEPNSKRRFITWLDVTGFSNR